VSFSFGSFFWDCPKKNNKLLNPCKHKSAVPRLGAVFARVNKKAFLQNFSQEGFFCVLQDAA